MSAKLSLYAVLLLALSAAGEKDILNSLEGTVNNSGDHYPPITLKKELDTNEIPTSHEGIAVQKENEILTKEDHSVENNITVPRLRISSTDSPLPTSTSAIPEETDMDLSVTSISTKSSVMDDNHKNEELATDSFPGCGKMNRRFRRIVGGRSSQFGEHPWQAALYTSDTPAKPYCGGTLLTDTWVITAAHCVDSRDTKTLTVRLGEYNTEKSVETLPHKDYKIARMVVHPGYDNFLDQIDIALLKLDGIVKFDQHIIPACLPRKNVDLSGQIATVSGWGRTKDGNMESKPAILREVEVEVFSYETCKQWYGKARKGLYFFNGYLCAGHKSGGKNTCNGDSGGPLTITINNRRVLIGVVVGGIDCSKKSLPGLYMSVTKYLNWIKNVIKS